MMMDNDIELAKRRHIAWAEIRRLADRLFVLTDEWLECDGSVCNLEREDLRDRTQIRLRFSPLSKPDDQG